MKLLNKPTPKTPYKPNLDMTRDPRVSLGCKARNKLNGKEGIVVAIEDDVAGGKFYHLEFPDGGKLLDAERVEYVSKEGVTIPESDLPEVILGATYRHKFSKDVIGVAEAVIDELGGCRSVRLVRRNKQTDEEIWELKRVQYLELVEEKPKRKIVRHATGTMFR